MTLSDMSDKFMMTKIASKVRSAEHVFNFFELCVSWTSDILVQNAVQLVILRFLGARKVISVISAAKKTWRVHSWQFSFFVFLFFNEILKNAPQTNLRTRISALMSCPTPLKVLEIAFSDIFLFEYTLRLFVRLHLLIIDGGSKNSEFCRVPTTPSYSQGHYRVVLRL